MPDVSTTVIATMMLLSGCGAYPSGAGSCTAPGSQGGSGHTGHRSSGNVQVSAIQTANADDTIQVTLSGSSFKGFLLKVDGAVIDMASLPTGTQQKLCPGTSAVTHIDSSSKTSLTFNVRMPSTASDVVLSGVVVTELTSWFDLEARIISVSEQSGGGLVIPPPASCTADEFNTRSPVLTAACCPDPTNCASGVPVTCSPSCAPVAVAFFRDCGDQMMEFTDRFAPFLDTCNAVVGSSGSVSSGPSTGDNGVAPPPTPVPDELQPGCNVNQCVNGGTCKTYDFLLGGHEAGQANPFASFVDNSATTGGLIALTPPGALSTMSGHRRSQSGDYLGSNTMLQDFQCICPAGFHGSLCQHYDAPGPVTYDAQCSQPYLTVEDDFRSVQNDLRKSTGISMFQQDIPSNSYAGDVPLDFDCTHSDRGTATGVGGLNWYRFQGVSGDAIAVMPPHLWHCGCAYPLWMSNWMEPSDPPHNWYGTGEYPEASEGVVFRTFCLDAGCQSGGPSGCPEDHQNAHCNHFAFGSAVRCDGFLLFQLPSAVFCNSIYCTDDSGLF